jgi:CheY-like chemotaxis protein/Tfp pilus assembly protein PilZ
MSRKLRILLADDSRFFRAIERQFLQKNPVEILEANSCESALACIREESPDLVYMAFSLPKEGGAVCCQRIKNDSLTSSIPVVIICDQGDPEQPEISRRHGCDAFLIKPLDRYHFLQAGRQFIDGIREHRQPSFFRVEFTAHGEEYGGKCLDLSGGGMFVECKDDIKVGTLVSMNFKLPDQAATQVVCKAVITWLNRRPNLMKPHYPQGIGFKFVEIAPSAHKAVLRLSNK